MMNELKEALGSVRAGEELKARTREYVANRAPRSRPAHRLGRWAAAAACALLLTGGGLFGWLWLSPVSAISMDINPSLELEVNRFGRVVAVEGFNDQGRALAQGLDLRFLPYPGAVERVLDDENVSALLDQGMTMSIYVICDDDTQREEMLATLESCTSGHHGVCCQGGGSGCHAEAHEAGFSTGRYRAYLRLRELDPSVTPEEAAGMTMAQLRERIAALGGEDEASSGPAGGYGAGKHHGNGHHGHE